MDFTRILELLARIVFVGAGATILIDLWALLLRRFGVRSLDFALLGRWIGHLPEGRWMHANIAEAAPVRGERVIGWCAHYAIGISFAAILLAVFGAAWGRSPSLLPALAVGIATVAAPLFVLQPALGLGIASSKTPRPVFNSVKSVVTHGVFGLGLYLAGLGAAAVVPMAK